MRSSLEQAEAVHDGRFAAFALVHQHVQRLHARGPGVAGEVVVRSDCQIGVRDAVTLRVDHHVVDALEQHLADRAQTGRELLRRVGFGGGVDQHADPGPQELLDEFRRRAVARQEPPVVESPRLEPSIPVAQIRTGPAQEAVDLARPEAGPVSVRPGDGDRLVPGSGAFDADLQRSQVAGDPEEVEPLLRGLHDAAILAIAVVAQPEVGKTGAFATAPDRGQGVGTPGDALDRVMHGRSPQSIVAGPEHALPQWLRVPV